MKEVCINLIIAHFFTVAKFTIIIICFFTGGKFAIYNTKLKRGYPGVAHSITCELVTGYVKLSTDFIAPNGRAVLSCSKHATVCTVKKDGYSLGRLLQRGYVLAIHHFNVSRDTGIWQCRDKGYTGPDDIASVEVKSAREYACIAYHDVNFGHFSILRMPKGCLKVVCKLW